MPARRPELSLRTRRDMLRGPDPEAASMNILQQTENRVEAYLKPRLRRLVKVFTKTLVDPRKL